MTCFYNIIHVLEYQVSIRLIITNKKGHTTYHFGKYPHLALG